MTRIITWALASSRLKTIRPDIEAQIRAIQVKYMKLIDVVWVQTADGGGAFDEGMKPDSRIFLVSSLQAGGVADAFGPEHSGIPARAMNIRFSEARESYIKGNSLPYVIEHEIGHTLGLAHSTTGLMRPDIAPGELTAANRTTLLNRWGAAKTDAQLAVGTLGHVVSLYRMTGRDPDPEGLQYWVSAPDSLPHLIHALGLSVSSFDLAVQAYRGLLGREPSHEEASWWGQIGSTFATSFIGTEEARARTALIIKGMRG